MVLLSLPFAPVVVLKTTVPLVALVFTPWRLRWRRELPLASLMKRTATPLVLVLSIVSSLAVPMPPGRPSKVRYWAPFKFNVAAVVLALVMVSAVAPVCGRIVTLLTALAPLSLGTVSGKVSALLM